LLPVEKATSLDYMLLNFREVLHNIDKNLFFARGSFLIKRRRMRFNIESIKQKQSSLLVIHHRSSEDNLLTKLFNKYGSDKGSVNGSIQGSPQIGHNYSNYYYEQFKFCRERVEKICEIGIGTNNPNVPSSMGIDGKVGASLRAWRDFFPNAIVIGGDVDPEILFQEDRISTFYVDQTNPESIDNFWKGVNLSNFDLIVDDGLHTYEAGSTLFNCSFDRLKSDGIYIIEDVTHRDTLRYVEFFKDKNVFAQILQFYNHDRDLGQSSLIAVRKSSR